MNVCDQCGLLPCGVSVACSAGVARSSAGTTVSIEVAVIEQRERQPNQNEQAVKSERCLFTYGTFAG